MSNEKKPEWVAEVFKDWTTLQILELGIAFAFNRESGMIYKIPSEGCPFVQVDFGVPNADLDGTKGCG